MCGVAALIGAGLPGCRREPLTRSAGAGAPLPHAGPAQAGAGGVRRPEMIKQRPFKYCLRLDLGRSAEAWLRRLSALRASSCREARRSLDRKEEMVSVRQIKYWSELDLGRSAEAWLRRLTTVRGDGSNGWRGAAKRLGTSPLQLYDDDFIETFLAAPDPALNQVRAHTACAQAMLRTHEIRRAARIDL